MRAATGGEWLSREARKAQPDDAVVEWSQEHPPAGPLIERLDGSSLAAVAGIVGLDVAGLVSRYDRQVNESKGTSSNLFAGG